MRVHTRTSQFGWPGDGGLGLKLIEDIRSGAKTATCGPVCLHSSAELTEVRATVGQLVTVIDVDGSPRCNIRILEVFEMPWSAPDMRVVRAEGFASVAEWQTALSRAWQDLQDDGTLTLTDETPMLAEMFELVDAS